MTDRFNQAAQFIEEDDEDDDWLFSSDEEDELPNEVRPQDWDDQICEACQ